MANNSSLIFWLALWMVAVVVLVLRQWRQKSILAGLILAHVANMWLVHWFAAAIYLLPWYFPLYAPETVFLGLQQASYATLAFAVGSLTLPPLFSKFVGFPRAGTPGPPDLRLPNIYMVFGLACYFVLPSLIGGLPSMGAILSGGWNLFLLGLIFKCWHAWHARHWNAFFGWVLVAIFIPLLTVVTAGFLGYGVVILLTLLSVIATFYRPRWQVAIVGCIALYLFLSVYVTYMRDRNAIRASVWGGQSYSRRFDVISETVFNPEAFDLDNQQHLYAVDGRLNQCALIGASVVYLQDGHKDFARGDTLIEAVQALIPRAVWADKPIKAGSGNLVSDYTGIEFAAGTSVGIGQVMEFYINFGTAGVIGGFFFLGIVVTLIDRAAGQRLREGAWKGATFWLLPGLALLQVGGALVEVTASAGGSIVLALFLNRVVLPRIKKKEAVPSH